MNKVLSNFDIERIGKRLNLNIVVLMKDEINALENMNFQNVIINLENHNQNGSHWCAIYKQANNIIYMDPFGIIFPQNEFNFFKTNEYNTYYNKVQIQDYWSRLCGYFCLLFLYIMNYDSSSFLIRFNNFLKLFERSKNKLKSNDNLIIEYIKEVLK